MKGKLKRRPGIRLARFLGRPFRVYHGATRTEMAETISGLVPGEAGAALHAFLCDDESRKGSLADLERRDPGLAEALRDRLNAAAAPHGTIRALDRAVHVLPALDGAGFDELRRPADGDERRYEGGEMHAFLARGINATRGLSPSAHLLNASIAGMFASQGIGDLVVTGHVAGPQMVGMAAGALYAVSHALSDIDVRGLGAANFLSRAVRAVDEHLPGHRANVAAYDAVAARVGRDLGFDFAAGRFADHGAKKSFLETLLVTADAPAPRQA